MHAQCAANNSADRATEFDTNYSAFWRSYHAADLPTNIFTV
jgi:hypothetical protein